MRPIIAIWRCIVRAWEKTKISFRFLDAHGSAVTAVATVFIALLTALYACYSQKQWESMQRQLADSEVAQSGRLLIEFDPEVLRRDSDFAIVRGDATVSNIGTTELTNVGGFCSEWSSYKPPEPHAHDVEATDFPNGGNLYPSKPPQTVCKIYSLPTQWDRVTKGKWFTGFAIAVSYRNIFGKLQVKSNCFMYYFRTGKYGPCPIPSNTPISMP